MFCSEGWAVSETALDLHDPRLLAMAAAERHFLEAEYDEYADASANGTAFCRSAALIVRLMTLTLEQIPHIKHCFHTIMLIITVATLQLLALLLLRHALYLTNGDGEDDAYTFFSVSKTFIFFPFKIIMLCTCHC